MTFVLQHTVSTSPNWFVQTWWSLLPDLHFKTQQGFPEKNAKLDYLKQLSHFLQLAMGGVRKKKKRLRKSLKWLITHNLKSPTRQAFWAKCFSGGGEREMRTRRRKICLRRRDSAPVGLLGPTVKPTSSRRQSHRDCPWSCVNAHTPRQDVRRLDLQNQKHWEIKSTTVECEKVKCVFSKHWMC